MDNMQLRIDYVLRLPTRYGEFKLRYLEFLIGHQEVGRHKHSDFEVIYVLNGDVIIKIAKNTFVLHKNQFIFLEPNILHEFYCDKVAEFCIFQFGEFRDNSNHQIIAGDTPLFARLNKIIDNHKVIDDTQNGEKILQSVKTELERKGWGYKLVVGNYIANLLYLCLRNLPDEDFSGKDYSEAPLEYTLPNQILNYMRLHLAENLTIENIAQHFFISSRHLNRLITQYYGVSFKQLQQHLRFIQAEKLLKDPALSLEEISEAIGYTSLRSLYDLFEKEIHTTPAKHRLKLLDTLK